VAPDVLLYRRWGQRYSVGAPPGTEPSPYTLFDGRGSESVFRKVGKLRIEGTPEGHDAPVIVWDRKVWTSEKDGVPRPKDGKKRTSLLSATSKMSCPSFSLPAGPTSEAGSCAAANLATRGKGLRTEGKSYICDMCYSLEGRYPAFEVAFSQAARFHWVLSSLEEDPTGERLGQSLTSAITDFARKASLSGVHGGAETRMTLELGVWRRGRISVPFRIGKRLQYVATPGTSLPSFTGFADTHDLIASMAPAEDEICGFFRIHDSGDFAVGKSPKQWEGYLRAWQIVATAMPKVVFWAPTRMWPFAAMRKRMLEVCASTPNLVIRPSALHVDDPAPTLGGMPQGTTVATRIEDGSYRSTTGTDGAPAWLCPVYTSSFWDEELVPRNKKRREAGEMGEFTEQTSCMEAGCRACWIAGKTPVAYGAH
jgi:hypothetical protein